MTVPNWTLKKFKIKDLKEYTKNPRRLTEAQYLHLKASLDKFGLVDKPIVTQEGQIIGGHQRIKVLKKDGVKEIECWVPDRELSEKEIEEANIRLNKNQGEWDFDILGNQFEMTDLLQWGFDPAELCLPEIDEIEPVEEDQEILEPGKDEDAIICKGDSVVLGDKHHLICGDSTDPDVVRNLLGDQIPILMVTDPPYGIKRDKGFGGFGGFGKPISRRQYNDNWDNERPSKQTFDLLINKVTLSIIWGGNFFADILPRSSHWIVWDKKQTMPSFGDCELAWTNSERKSVKKYEVEYNGLIGKEKERFHPTQKPLSLFCFLIKDYSTVNDFIFDPFLGSGTTLIACEQLDRICYGIEISPAYCDIIIKRWIKYRLKKGLDAIVKCNGQIDERWNA